MSRKEDPRMLRNSLTSILGVLFVALCIDVIIGVRIAGRREMPEPPALSPAETLTNTATLSPPTVKEDRPKEPSPVSGEAELRPSRAREIDSPLSDLTSMAESAMERKAYDKA